MSQNEGQARQPADNDEKADDMSLMDHLHELRARLVRSLIALIAGFAACYAFSEIFLDFIMKVAPQDTRFIFTALPEAFFVHLKVSLMAGFFLSCPYIFYQIWAFIAPGLYVEERKSLVVAALASCALFVIGAAFCYKLVLPFAIPFFLSYGSESLLAMPDIDEYLSLVLKLLLAFGIIFEMPLFSYLLAQFGILTAQGLRNARRYAIVAIITVAAVLTPPDIASQVMLAVPMYILYEAGIWIVQTTERKKSEQDFAAGD
jgi:sec-independent protein translocase protein TatC